jgi:bifunctional non-homologous end joining protein LigD
MAGLKPESREVQQVIEQLEQAGEDASIAVSGQQVRVTHLNKVLWPASAGHPPVTKRALLHYLAVTSPHLLRYLRDRPITIVRFPNGVTGQTFVQRHAEHVPTFVQTFPIFTEDVEADRDYLLCNNLATLLWLGQMNALEIHGWYARIVPDVDLQRPTNATGSEAAVESSVVNYPDFLVFDLDPYVYSGKEKRGGEPELHRAGFSQTAEVALRLKEVLDNRHLIAYPKTSGRTGIHVFVPTRRTLPYAETHSLAKEIAEEIVERYPKLATVQWAIKKRRSMILIDINQNVRGKTLPPPYSPRRSAEASVSMPIRWEELGAIYPSDFTIHTAPARLAEIGDLWADILETGQDLAHLHAGQWVSKSA